MNSDIMTDTYKSEIDNNDVIFSLQSKQGGSVMCVCT